MYHCQIDKTILKYSMHRSVSNKQIMTGLEGNRLSISIETLREAILNLKGQIDSLLPEGPVIIFFIIPLCYSKEKNDYFNLKLISSTMGLVTKNT